MAKTRAKTLGQQAAIDATTIVAAKPCPKCGSTIGWTGPHYQQGKRVTVKRVRNAAQFANDITETTESLTYTCNTCGFVRHEACSDNGGPRITR